MIENLNILVVEDDGALRDAVSLTLEMAGHRIVAVDGGPAALEAAAQGGFQLVVTDLRMQPMDGLALLEALRGRWPHLPVLLMTAYGDVSSAVAAMRGGACDFLMKPFEPEALLERVRRYAAVPPGEADLVATDPATVQALALAARVAETDATVMLAGESGTGKEVFARYIHSHSPRKVGPFVAINCAAIPENLLEATLFGYERGAFTGAQNAQPGKFEQAQGGTLLLDEISEMPLGLQAKLLRVLQEREVERVGGKKAIALDIRVLATSNRNMLAEVSAGRFREDLFYRLNVFPLAIPALRERPGDIVPLARHFLQRHGDRMRRLARFSPEAEACLTAYGWPGNVRELENTVQRAMILATGELITPATLALCLPVSIPPLSEKNLGAENFAGSSAVAPTAMRDLERDHILTTLKAVGGSRRRAVEKLGISERTLRYKLHQYRSEGFEV
ncbi:MAG: sigma-54-dependent Fis family transcriptional regulator [Zoogloeaceae bacterium]|nr:sigma-54-dependent Fis family transcriptional regulator [Zoogloeaceae bacterium]